MNLYAAERFVSLAPLEVWTEDINRHAIAIKRLGKAQKKRALNMSFMQWKRSGNNADVHVYSLLQPGQNKLILYIFEIKM